ncbi:MAG: hypothetical protein HQ503_10220, partial [Rhodospirillales bacterium]|nr:hypothetical protein [Rhodospirillales bacterium]
GDAAAAADAYAGALKTDPDNQIFWTNHLFALNFSPDADAQDIFERNRAWGRRLEETISAVAIGLSDPDPERKLHLAYYLPELNTHVTPRFLEPVLGAHDTALFRISLYGSRTDGAPPPPSLIQDHRWVDIAGQSDAAIAGRMQSDQVDILLHPCTFKARYRSLLAHRAAPVQIAGINLVSTTGLSAADYLMTDAALDPPGKSERYYSEKLIRLPAFNTYRTPAAAPDIGPLPASLNAGVTFGSLNNPVKLSDRAIAAWAEILNKLDGARLILKHRSLANEDVVGRYQSRFQAAGAGQDHLIFEGFTSDAGAYLDSYNRIDIALDPFPFGGGTTSYEAIWMGVPIITMEGRTLMGRLTASFMHRLGLSEWVAADPESYVKCAIRLAGDLDALAALRAQMRDRARTTIFDAEAFTRSLEDACRGVWRQTVSEL